MRLQVSRRDGSQPRQPRRGINVVRYPAGRHCFQHRQQVALGLRRFRGRGGGVGFAHGLMLVAAEPVRNFTRCDYSGF